VSFDVTETISTIKVTKVKSVNVASVLIRGSMPIDFDFGIAIPQHLLAILRLRQLTHAILFGSTHFILFKQNEIHRILI